MHSGSVGWLGLVFVARLGAELTRTSLAALDRLGCTTVLLAATKLGKPIYDRFDFVEDTGGGYSVWRGPVDQPQPIHPRIRPLKMRDLPRVYAIDRAATDEDRAHALRALANGWVLEDGECIRGYALRTPWGLGPAVTRDDDDEQTGMRLLDVLIAHGGSPEVQLIVPTSNDAAARVLAARGFAERRRLPRMRRGQPLAWRPRRIWSIFNFAFG